MMALGSGSWGQILAVYFLACSSAVLYHVQHFQTNGALQLDVWKAR